MSRTTTTERRTLDQDETETDTTKASGPDDMSQYHPHTQAVIEALAGATFPATPAALIETARNNMAPDLILQRLGNLSAELYPNLDSVTESIGL